MKIINRCIFILKNRRHILIAKPVFFLSFLFIFRIKIVIKNSFIWDGNFSWETLSRLAQNATVLGYLASLPKRSVYLLLTSPPSRLGFGVMEGKKSRGYAWAISAGINAALAAISAKLFSSQVIFSYSSLHPWICKTYAAVPQFIYLPW